MLTEETIRKIKATIDTTLIELFDITQEQLRSFEDSDINPSIYSMFDYKIDVPGKKPQFFSVMLKNHPIEGAKYLIITTTDHKFEDGVWMIHNPSHVINTTDIKESSEGEVSPQFYETLANQLGLAYFTKQELEPKAVARLIPNNESFYTEIEPLDTSVPINETNLTLITYDEHDNKSLKLTVPSSVWLERDGYTKNTYPIEHYVYDTDQEQFRLYAKHIGDPTITRIERRQDTDFYHKMKLHSTPSLRFPFNSPEDFVTQSSISLSTSNKYASIVDINKQEYQRAIQLMNKFRALDETTNIEPEDEPSL